MNKHNIYIHLIFNSGHLDQAYMWYLQRSAPPNQLPKKKNIFNKTFIQRIVKLLSVFIACKISRDFLEFKSLKTARELLFF